MLHSTSRVIAMRFDAVTRRFVGDVSLTRADGTVETVRASVVGNARWPMERAARMLIGAARLDRVA